MLPPSTRRTVSPVRDVPFSADGGLAWNAERGIIASLTITTYHSAGCLYYQLLTLTSAEALFQ
jgi:hypothetical protein